MRSLITTKLNPKTNVYVLTPLAYNPHTPETLNTLIKERKKERRKERKKGEKKQRQPPSVPAEAQAQNKLVCQKNFVKFLQEFCHGRRNYSFLLSLVRRSYLEEI